MKNKIIYKIRLILFLTLFLVSCNNLDNQLKGGWVVDQAYYNNEPVVWDLFGNGFDLNNDYTCVLPVYNSWDRNTVKQKGTWTTYKDKNILHLKILTTNQLFNRDFQILRLRKIKDKESLGSLLKMTIVSDSLKMDCTKALYE
jgi:hypothetical protein